MRAMWLVAWRTWKSMWRQAGLPALVISLLLLINLAVYQDAGLGVLLLMAGLVVGLGTLAAVTATSLSDDLHRGPLRLGGRAAGDYEVLVGHGLGAAAWALPFALFWSESVAPLNGWHLFHGGIRHLMPPTQLWPVVTLLLTVTWTAAAVGRQVTSAGAAVLLTWFALFGLLVGEGLGATLLPGLRLFHEDVPIALGPMLAAHVLALVSSTLRLPGRVSPGPRARPRAPVPARMNAVVDVGSSERGATPVRVR
jgi:hypothetical protein